MDKNVVKLNESQLKKIVAESVKKVLSEIDWKTYANAARKSYSKREVEPFVQYGHKDRANKFAAAAEKAFNDDYGTDNVRGRISLKGRYGGQGSYEPLGDEKGALSLNTHAWNKEPADSRENHNGVISTQVKPGVGYDYDKGIHRTPAEFYHGGVGAYGAIDNAGYENLDNDVKNAFDSAENEFSNYVNGNYVYDNEKGWHLKESVLHKIVAKSIRKVLKEGIRDIGGLGEEIRDAEDIAYELREQIGALQSKVDTRYGYVPVNNDEYDDGIKKNLENAYSAIKQCIFALDNAFQLFDGGDEPISL